MPPVYVAVAAHAETVAHWPVPSVGVEVALVLALVGEVVIAPMLLAMLVNWLSG